MPRAPEPDPPGIPELPAGLVGTPSARAGVAYRLLRIAFRAIAFALRFRVRVEGLEHLPRTADGRAAGRWIAAGIPHRSWIDPFLLWVVLPAEPRLVFFGDARTMARSPFRRWVVRRVGGILPIPSHGGPRAFATHLAAAAAVLDAGAVFCLFPERGHPVPPERARPIAPGIGYVALRSGAPIVPVIIGGNDELHLGRTLVVRIQPALDARTIAGDAPERTAAHRVAEVLHEHTAVAVARAYADTRPPEGAPRRWTGLTTLFR